MSRRPQTRFGARRLAREWAIQVLYQLDVQGGLSDERRVEEALGQHHASFAHEEKSADAPDFEEASSYRDEVVRGVSTRLSAVDASIQAASQHWKLERMARVDRNILRLAAWEIVTAQVPARVAINEAVDVAKKFGTEESGAFVNGILDRIAQDSGA